MHPTICWILQNLFSDVRIDPWSFVPQQKCTNNNAKEKPNQRGRHRCGIYTRKVRQHQQRQYKKLGPEGGGMEKTEVQRGAV